MAQPFREISPGALRSLAPDEVNRLATLASISRRVNLSGPTPEVLQSVLEILVKTFSAERGKLRLFEPDLDVSLDTTAEVPQQDFRYSRTVVERVAGQGESVVSLDAMQDQVFSSSESLRTLGICSVMCAPLPGLNRTLGWIYLDSRAFTGVFTESDLELLEIVSGMVAASIERAQYSAEAIEKSRRLEVALEELKLANRVKSEFMLTMSHELRTPLTSVIGFGQLLQHDGFGPELSEQQKEFVAQILESGARLLTMVGDVLNLTELETGRFHLDLRPTELMTLLDQVVADLARKTKEREIQISIECSSPPPSFRADPERVKDVLRHLIDNAIKFNRRGGSVRVEVEPAGDELRLRVIDSGIGIRAENREHIFERFRQLDQSITRSYEGLGLGLALVKRLIELHGGRIWVSSDGVADEGTAFELVLPLISGTRPPESTFDTRQVDSR